MLGLGNSAYHSSGMVIDDMDGEIWATPVEAVTTDMSSLASSKVMGTFLADCAQIAEHWDIVEHRISEALRADSTLASRLRSLRREAAIYALMFYQNRNRRAHELMRLTALGSLHESFQF